MRRRQRPAHFPAAVRSGAALVRAILSCGHYNTPNGIIHPYGAAVPGWKTPALAPTVGGRFYGAKGTFTMALKPEFRRSTLLATALALLAAAALTIPSASPARADHCDDL